MSYDYEGNERGGDGTFHSSQGYSGLHVCNTWEQREAGINFHDNELSASMKLGAYRTQQLEHHYEQLRKVSAGGYGSSGSYYPPEHTPATSSSFFRGLRRLLVLTLVIGTLIGAAFGALWYVDNKDRVPYLAQRWAIKAAFHGQEFAPWSRYESLVPSASKALQLTPRQLAFALNKSRKQSMKNSKRFQLGAAAWKCILEHSERCLQQAASGPMGGATLTMVAAIDFLEAARNKGNTDAAADVGLIYVIHHGGLLDSVMRARTEWTKSVQENPESVRAQALLDLSSNSLALHTAAWISQQTRM